MSRADLYKQVQASIGRSVCQAALRGVEEVTWFLQGNIDPDQDFKKALPLKKPEEINVQTKHFQLQRKTDIVTVKKIRRQRADKTRAECIMA